MIKLTKLKALVHWSTKVVIYEVLQLGKLFGIEYIKHYRPVVSVEILAKKLYDLEKDLTNISFKVTFTNKKVIIECNKMGLEHIYTREQFNKEFENG